MSLPSSWRRTTLREVAARVPNAIVDGPFGSSLKLTDYRNDGVPVLQGKNITGDKFCWSDVRFISHEKAETLKRSSVRAGDILIVKIGSIGYSAVVDRLACGDFAIIPANLAKVTPDAATIDTRYLHRWLTSGEAKRYLTNAASKTAQPALSLEKIKQVPVVLPPLREQRRIADILDRADAIRTKRREAIVQLDALRKAVYRDVIEAGGPSRRLADCVDAIQIGPFGSLLHETDYIAGGVPLVNPKHIRDGQIVPAAETVAPERLRDLGLYRLRTGDVVLGRRGEMGRCAIVTDKEDGWVCGTGSMFVRPKEGVTNAYFVAAALSSPSGRAWLESSALGITLLNLNKGIVSDFPVRLAPFRLQQELERQVRAVDSLKAAHRASLAEMDALFVSLQHRAFRGEL